MRILFLVTGLGGGGAENVVVNLADAMYAQGHQVKIAYLTGEVVVRPQQPEIELIYLELEGIASSYKSFAKYHLVLKQFSPDVVHAHMVHANIFARLSRIVKPTKRLICTAHSSNEGGELRMLAYRLTHRWSDITTNVSMSAAENFQRLGAVPEGGICTVYNGIDLSKFQRKMLGNQQLREQLGIDSQQKIILAVGRLHEAKDYPNLIQSFHLFKSQLVDGSIPKLLIVGEGEQRQHIQHLIEKLDLLNDVQLLGRREDIGQLMSIADYFVLSSSFEGLPTVLIEAQACEVFVVATNCGGASEVMGETGIRVPIKNAQALANALFTAFNMSQQAIDENNVQARQRVENMFSLTHSVQKWLEIYASK